MDSGRMFQRSPSRVPVKRHPNLSKRRNGARDPQSPRWRRVHDADTMHGRACLPAHTEQQGNGKPMLASRMVLTGIAGSLFEVRPTGGHKHLFFVSVADGEP